MDTNKKFLYVNPAASNEDAARTFPVSSLLAMHMDNTDSLILTFEDALTNDHTSVDITITDGAGQTVIKEFVEAINFAKDAVVVLANNADDSSVSANIDFGTAPTITDGVGQIPLQGIGLTNEDAQNATITAAEFATGLILHTSATGAGAVTLDTAANLIAGLGLTADNMSARCYYVNDGNQDVTLNEAATGVTYLNNPTVAAEPGVTMVVRRTGAAAVSVFYV